MLKGLLSRSLLLLIPLFFFGCGQGSRDFKKDEGSSEASEEGSGKENVEGWSIGRPFQHDSMDRVLFPVRKSSARSRKERSYLSSSDHERERPYSSYSGFERTGHFLNLIQWDPVSDRHSLLKDSLLHMTRFRYLPMLDQERSGMMLYHLIPEDRNEDGEFRRHDGTALYASLPDGSRWKRLTPEGHRVLAVHVLKKEGVILVRTEKGKGNEVHHLRTSLDNPRMATRFLEPSFLKKLKRRLGE